MIRLIKTNDGDYINVNHIIWLSVEKEEDAINDDCNVVIYTSSPANYNARNRVTCDIGDKDIAVEICCAIANFMQSTDKNDTLFCVQTYVSKTWPEESHLKLVTNNEETDE